MRYFFYFLPIVSIIACSDTGGPTVSEPGSVVFVAKTADTDSVEQGIDAVPDQNGILLEWETLKEENLKYYDIYRQRDGETYFKKIKSIDIETASTGEATRYIDDPNDIIFNIYNFYYIRAVNKDGISGAPSDTVQYKLMQKPILVRPKGETITGLPIFEWNFPDVIPDSYILRIMEEFTERIIFVREFQTEEYFSEQSLDLATKANPPEFISGFTYRWRIDSVGAGIIRNDDGSELNYSGSESEWSTFIAN